MFFLLVLLLFLILLFLVGRLPVRLRMRTGLIALWRLCRAIRLRTVRRLVLPGLRLGTVGLSILRPVVTRRLLRIWLIVPGRRLHRPIARLWAVLIWPVRLWAILFWPICIRPAL